MDLSTFSSLTDVLHALAQALLVPDIILLLLFAGYALFCIGSILMEYFTERRNFKVTMPKFLAALMSATEDTVPEVIRTSGLLNRQKTALLTVYDYRTLPGDALLALIRRTVQGEETRYARITGRNNTAAKISPMLGLMGTLIPLGPGVAALGQADPSLLSSSLLIAFDTTVAGLAVAAVCMAVGKIRGTWYNDYLSALESGMATLPQKIEDMRADGTLSAEEPTDYAFMFEQGLKKTDGVAKSTEPAAEDAAGTTEPDTESSPAAGGAAASPFGTAAAGGAAASPFGTAAAGGAAASPFAGATASTPSHAATPDRVRPVPSHAAPAASDAEASSRNAAFGTPRADAAPSQAPLRRPFAGAPDSTAASDSPEKQESDAEGPDEGSHAPTDQTQRSDSAPRTW